MKPAHNWFVDNRYRIWIFRSQSSEAPSAIPDIGYIGWICSSLDWSVISGLDSYSTNTTASMTIRDAGGTTCTAYRNIWLMGQHAYWDYFCLFRICKMQSSIREKSDSRTFHLLKAFKPGPKLVPTSGDHGTWHKRRATVTNHVIIMYYWTTSIRDAWSFRVPRIHPNLSCMSGQSIHVHHRLKGRNYWRHHR